MVSAQLNSAPLESKWQPPHSSGALPGGALSFQRPSACAPGLPQTSTLWESDGVITGFTCWFPFPQRSLSLLLSAFWCFKLLPHIFCLGISVCFVTVAKRANPISVKSILVNQKGSPQTPSLSQKKVWLGQEAFPRSEVVHKLCWTHLSGLRFDRVVPDTT